MSEELDQIEVMVTEIQALREMEQLADGIGNAFANSFERAVFEAQALRDIIRALGMDILRLIFRQTITQPLANAISGGLQSIGQGIGGLFSTGAPSSGGSGGGGGGVGGGPYGLNFRLGGNVGGGESASGGGGFSSPPPGFGGFGGGGGGGAQESGGRGGRGGPQIIINITGVPSQREADLAASRMRRAARSAVNDPRAN